jgi:hypothetical protein
MQLAYQTTQPVGTKDPVGIRRWRKLFITKPDKFLAILADQEKRLLDKQEASRKHCKEFEALGMRVVELEAENKTLKTRIAEFEAKLPDVDEYDDPAINRLRELREKLAKEPLAKIIQKCPQCLLSRDPESILERKCVHCWAALAKQCR